MNKFRILLVEDSIIAQKIAKLVLTDLNCSVDVAENGEEAIKLFKAHQYCLVFMDIGLSDMSGVDVTRKIRQLEGTQKHTPIVALTANYEESAKQSFVEQGLDEFLQKPLTHENGQPLLSKYCKEVKL